MLSFLVSQLLLLYAFIYAEVPSRSAPLGCENRLAFALYGPVVNGVPQAEVLRSHLWNARELVEVGIQQVFIKAVGCWRNYMMVVGCSKMGKKMMKGCCNLQHVCSTSTWR